jgi:uncharacterized iron-regulated membrane protein
LVIPQEEKEEGRMKLDRVSQASRFSIRPILWRQVHKWVGLILGLQFVIWTISGAIMALLDMEKVGGHSAAGPVEVGTPWAGDLVPISNLGTVEGLTLKRVLDQPVYEVTRRGEITLLDARTGSPMSIDGPQAAAIAKQAFHHEAPVRSVERLEKPNLEAREHAAPMWRVNFADDENSSSYVSAVNGAPLVNRGDTWRTWDFVWMLHNMDYANRTSFNHPLIVFVAFGTLWLSFTGFYLLFKSFRRREFNWVLGKR